MATRGRTPEGRCEVARLLPRPTCGGAPSPPLTSVLPTLIPVETRERRGGGGEIPPPSLWQPLSLTNPSRGERVCERVCEREKSKTFGNCRELPSPTVCRVSEFFNTQGTGSVGASAVTASAVAGVKAAWWRRRWRRRPPRRGGAGRCENWGGALGEHFSPIFTAPSPRSPIFTTPSPRHLAPQLHPPDAGGGVVASEGGGAAAENPRDTPLRSANQAAPLYRPVAPCLVQHRHFPSPPASRRPVAPRHLTPPRCGSDLE